jgi:hypothetical protein
MIPTEISHSEIDYFAYGLDRMGTHSLPLMTNLRIQTSINKFPMQILKANGLTFTSDIAIN